MARTSPTAILLNLAMAAGSLLITVALLEFVVFALILKPSEIPTPQFSGGLIRYEPGEEGTTRVGNEIEALWRINAQGWNSGHRHYTKWSKPQVSRIAIVGDSYVDARQVAFDESLAERLENDLGEEWEVYRFGMSGAPMSQYLHMIRTEVIGYQPCLLVIVVAHNDFAESYRYRAGVYTSSFLKLTIEPDGSVTEQIPTSYEPRWFESIRTGSSTWRYLVGRQNVRFSLLRELLLPTRDNEEAANQTVVSSVRADSIAAAYVLAEVAQITRDRGIHTLLLIDGDRRFLMTTPPDSTRLQRLSRTFLNIAADQGLPAVDLDPIFRAAYQATGQPVHFESDFHWNGNAHQIVADRIRLNIRSENAAGRPFCQH